MKAKTWERVRGTVLATISKHGMIREKEHIVLGLSGGPDSVCLFDILDGASAELGLTIHAVHVNHGLRPGAAEEDQRYVEELCASRGVDCRSYVCDCAAEALRSGVSTEEAGRALRYGAFRSRALETGSRTVAVAQNSDDRAETVILRILRGTGPDGLASIPYVRSEEGGLRIIRPLLDVSKEEVLAYCRERGLAARTDQTNLEPLYARNRVRLELLPELQGYNPAVKEALNRLADAAAEDRSFLEEQAGEASEKLREPAPEGVRRFDGRGLRALHPAIRRRVVQAALKSLGLAEDMTEAHFRACDEIIMRGNASSETFLPHGYRLRRVYDKIELLRQDGRASGEEGSGSPSPAVELRVCVLTLPEYRERSAGRCRGSYAGFDLDRFRKAFGRGAEERIVLRTRRAGDMMRIASGRKKLQDILVDDKVPKAERDSLAVVAAGAEVLMLCRGDRSRYYCGLGTEKDTKKVLYIELDVSVC